ncbi:hypothetical protein DFR67_105242 [Williamsia limnetica]|uniref:VOC domain-containing protein n=1 Tax=Williamsia limnetica TaxID=882452 RepID=A0A318S372_WILLI|nr:VOC family protein [Williamsia limnetica]PYE18097.1 hypothetical protein DFR67_105242 [Williamsia limnetica]
MPAIDSHPDGVAVWIDLSSTEPDRAATFYGDLFGWDRTEPDEQMGGYSQFTHQDKLVAGLGPKQSPDVPDFWCTYFQTPDIEATVKQVSTSGGSVFVPPMEIPGQGTMAIVMDPGSDPGANGGHNGHGAVFGFWEPREHRGFQLYMEAGAPCYFELLTTDFAKAVDFYPAATGRQIVTLSDTDEFRYAQLSLPDTAPGEGYAGIMDGSGFLPAEVPSHWSIYIGVADADATATRVGELGGTVVDAPTDTPYGRLATISDPWGAQIKLQQVP